MMVMTSCNNRLVILEVPEDQVILEVPEDKINYVYFTSVHVHSL